MQDGTQQKYDPLTSTLQTACVVVSGLERQFFVLVNQDVKLSKLTGQESINELFMQNGQIVEDELKNAVQYIDKIDDNLLNLDVCKRYIQLL